jgi:hypothetical protein
MRREPTPEDFDQLVKIARLQGDGLHIRGFSLPSGRWIPSTARKDFTSAIGAVVEAAWEIADINSAGNLKIARDVARDAQKLVNTLSRMSLEEKRHFTSFLPNNRREKFDDLVAFVRELATEGRLILILRLSRAKRRGRSERRARQSLVKGLLDAAADAGGKLTVNKRSERGSLVEALHVLKNSLPPELHKKLSFSTLVGLRKEWVRNRKKNSRSPKLLDPRRCVGEE